MKWFDWIRPPQCEISGCSSAAAQSGYILASAQAWFCTAHAELLDVGGPHKTPPPVR